MERTRVVRAAAVFRRHRRTSRGGGGGWGKAGGRGVQRRWQMPPCHLLGGARGEGEAALLIWNNNICTLFAPF